MLYTLSGEVTFDSMLADDQYHIIENMAKHHQGISSLYGGVVVTRKQHVLKFIGNQKMEGTREWVLLDKDVEAMALSNGNTMVLDKIPHPTNSMKKKLLEYNKMDRTAKKTYEDDNELEFGSISLLVILIYTIAADRRTFYF